MKEHGGPFNFSSVMIYLIEKSPSRDLVTSLESTTLDLQDTLMNETNGSLAMLCSKLSPKELTSKQ